MIKSRPPFAPEWPYQPWGSKSSVEPIGGDPILKTPVEEGSTFQELITNAKSMSSFPNSTRDQRLVSDVDMMVMKTVKLLSNFAPLFSGCYPIRSGSVEEKTKLSKQDEVDYLLVLKSENLKRFGDIILLYSYIEELSSCFKQCDIDFPSLPFTEAFKQIIERYIEKSLLPGWSLGTTHRTRYLHACTCHLFYEDNSSEEKEGIAVDLCLAVETDESLFQNSLDLGGLMARTMQFYLQNGCQVIGLVNMNRPNTDEKSIPFRIERFVVPELEKDMFRDFEKSNNRVICYRIIKFLAKAYLPTYFSPSKYYTATTHLRNDEEIDQSPLKISNTFSEWCYNECYNSIISSHCLKNTVMYMVENYPDDAKWTDDELGNRVLEAFLILRRLTDNKDLLSAYFWPEFHSLKGIALKCRIHDRDLPQYYDSRKPQSEERTLPMADGSLKTVGIETPKIFINEFSQITFLKTPYMKWSPDNASVHFKPYISYINKLESGMEFAAFDEVSRPIWQCVEGIELGESLSLFIDGLISLKNHQRKEFLSGKPEDGEMASGVVCKPSDWREIGGVLENNTREQEDVSAQMSKIFLVLNNINKRLDSLDEIKTEVSKLNQRITSIEEQICKIIHKSSIEK